MTNERENGHAPARLHKNAEGEYYTTQDCDGCAYCAAVAPENFEFDREHNTYFVSKQPATGEERDYVDEAMEDCPVNAIRKAGADDRPE